MNSYHLISADSHINEPPDLWTSRAPANLKARVPRMERMELGDAWIIEGAMGPINFGMNQCAGLAPEDRKPWIRWEESIQGGHDPKARVEAISKDGVDAELLYPTPRISNAVFWQTKDVDLHVATIRAYNDWLSEFCSADLERFAGIAMMPNVGAKVAVEELHRVMTLPGIRGAMLGQYPSGGLTIAEEDDAFWFEAEDLDVPVSIHISFANQPQGETKHMKVSGDFRFFDAPLRSAEFINTLVFDRFPNLQIVLAEVDCGWVPYAKEQMDNRYRRSNPLTRPQHNLPPSAYFERNLFYTMVTDSYGVRNRADVGVDQLMWSSDFPHLFSDWPNSWVTINDHFSEVSEAERYKILAGNVVRLYGLGS